MRVAKVKGFPYYVVGAFAKGAFTMKIVLIKSPKILAPILRKIFKVKK